MLFSILFCVFCLSSLTVGFTGQEFQARLEQLSAKLQALEDQSEAKDVKIDLLTQQLQQKGGLTHHANRQSL